ncbi:MAG: hypothetical protein ACPGUV_11635, partial [Polyangiales bacterium]
GRRFFFADYDNDELDQFRSDIEGFESEEAAPEEDDEEFVALLDVGGGVTNVHINADVPLGEMFGYIGDLRSSTSGRGQFSMEFSHYAATPRNVLEQVKEEVRARAEAKKK